MALQMPALDERFSKALHYTARAWRQSLDRRLKDLGLGQAGWLTIACAAASETPLSQSEIATQVGVEGATMVAMIDRLVKADLVKREPSPADRRVKLIVLTEQGQLLYARVKKEADICRKELLSGIDENLLLQTTELLEKLRLAAESL
jgi:MarR family transcriptional regulator for hemolysin